MRVTIEIDVPEETIRHYEAVGFDWRAYARKLIEDYFFSDAALQKLTLAKARINQQEALQENSLSAAEATSNIQ